MNFDSELEKVRSDLHSISWCGLAVAKCDQKKRLVHEPNHFQVERYGPRKYSWQCLKCLRKSAAFTPDPALRPSAVPFNPAEQKALEQKKDALNSRYSELYTKRSESEKRDWIARYEAVLQSPEWKEKRRLVLIRCKGVCEGCGQRPATEIHHLTYAMLGREMLFQLVGVCDHCHAEIHSEKTERPPVQ